MIEIEVKAEGQLGNNLRELDRKYKSRVENATRAAAKALYNQSQITVPRDTQALANSGGVRQKEGGLNSSFIVGYGLKDFTAVGYGEDREHRPPYMYAVYVHQMYHPFLTDAIDIAWNEMIEVYNAEVFG